MSELSNGESLFPSGDFSAADFESSRQSLLRGVYDAMATENAVIIAQFNPRTEVDLVDIDTSLDVVQHLGDEEPILSSMLMENMLKSVGIYTPEAPTDKRVILTRHFAQGIHLTLWYEQIDRKTVPIYMLTNPVNEANRFGKLALMPYGLVEEARSYYAECDELWWRIRDEVGISAEEMSAMNLWDVNRMRQIVTIYDEIQSLGQS